MLDALSSTAMGFARIDFKREGRWLLIVAALVPAIGMLVALVLPALLKRL